MKTTIVAMAVALVLTSIAHAQLTDVTQTPNSENSGIKKSLSDQVGPGRGDVMTPDSSLFIIRRDPFRSVMRGRQLFQRKFTRSQGLGPRTNDGVGNIELDVSHGAGLADSCAACHGRPRGSAGFGGDVFTRPDSRDAPHLFGIGLVEMLGDEITTELRAIRDQAVARAIACGQPTTKRLKSKGIRYGKIIGNPDGTVDTSLVEGVDADLRVRPFFHHGGEFSIRGFAIGAFRDEMGLESPDPDFLAASTGGVVTTPGGLVLDGTKDPIKAPPVSTPIDDADNDGVTNEIDTALIDHMEVYLLNYFKPGIGKQTNFSRQGLRKFKSIGCAECHVQDLTIDHDRRVADVETVYDPANGVFNKLFATAIPKFDVVSDGSGFADLKNPTGGSFVVKNIFADFKRHDLGPNFYERNFDGTYQKEFMTEPLWGVGTTGPYGHDGRSISLRDVILRHGGAAQTSRNKFNSLSEVNKLKVEQFLRTLVIFGPPDTASNLDPADPSVPNYPQKGHGSIDLSALFNNPSDKE